MLVLLGVGVGAGTVLLSSPVYRARARVLLPPSTVDAKGNDLRDPKTEAYIIASSQILDPAGKSLKPPMTVQELRPMIHVRAVSTQIEEVAADAPSASEAARVANAVAEAYVAANDRAASGSGDLSTSFLTDQVTHLNEQIGALNDQIIGDTAALKGLSRPDTQRQASVIDSLRSQEASLTEQLIAIQSRIADAQLSTQLARQGTRLLQQASAPADRQGPSQPLRLAAGGLGGLLLGAVMVLGIEQADRRLRHRDEIAAAAGAPVLASLDVPRSPSEQTCRDVLERRDPSIVDSLVLQQAFVWLGFAAGSPSHLIIVSLPADAGGALLSLQLACHAARSRRTAFIFGNHNTTNASLRAACLTVAASGSMRAGMRVFGAGDDAPTELDGFDLIVTSIVSNPGPLVLPTWDRHTVATLAVSSGAATHRRLEAMALACQQADQVVAGVFVANPTSDDHTTGRLGPPSQPTVEQLALPPGRSGPAFRANSVDDEAADDGTVTRARAAAEAFARLKAARAADEEAARANGGAATHGAEPGEVTERSVTTGDSPPTIQPAEHGGRARLEPGSRPRRGG
ncbi:MAG: hypothetical protein M3N98_15405, partial [Actinomycetota bacterium]|nr:hypothetical protein [Actinomycetota bacterium]